MDIIVNKVFDTLKFAYFIRIKYNYSLSYTNTIIESINKYGPIKFYNLLECEIRYLQRSPLEYGKYFIAVNKPICDLKIINMKTVKSIPPYLDNGRKSYIDISPQPGDEPKQESLDLFHVTFTKIIHYDEMLNERQIQALLKDNHVKSININK